MRASSLALALKRAGDVAVSVAVLLLGAPVWLLIGFLVAVTSEGPILFLQERPGFGGVPFVIYKFRTMRLGSEVMVEGQEVSRDDERVTPIGRLLRRTKIDEIPQLWNILKGDMSIVGPRPERMASLVDYTEDVARRLSMKPGLTGLAQVSGNIHLNLEERYRLDLYYVDNFSLCLDVRIIIRTIGVVLFGEQRYVHRSLVRSV